MATATMPLEKSLGAAQEKLSKALRSLRETDAQFVDESKQLAGLQARLEDERHRLATGKKADLSALHDSIRHAEDKLGGLAIVKRNRERDVAEARAELHEIEAEVGRIEQRRAVERELAEVKALVEATGRHLDTRIDADRRVIDGIVALRDRAYIDPRNKSLAFDAAFALQRRSCGMRP